MFTSLPSVPAGENPYLNYRAVLEAAKPSPTDKTGLKIRLIVLFALLVYAFVFSLANLGVHLYASKLKGRSLWLFRLVRRQGGTHIVSNRRPCPADIFSSHFRSSSSRSTDFILSGLVGVACAPVLITNVCFVWSAFLGDGSGIEKMLVLQFSALPVAYFTGWLLTWATFQSFLQVEGGRHSSRFAVPAWIETMAYVGGVIVLVGTLVALMVPAALANNKQWETFHACIAFLDSAAASWDGSTLSSEALQAVARELADVQATAEAFYAAARRLAIAGAILPAILLLLNGGMWFFVHTIRKQVSFQLEKLTATQISTINNDGAPASPIDGTPPFHSTVWSSPEKQQHRRPHPYPAPPSSDSLPTFIPLKVLPKTDPFRKTTAKDSSFSVSTPPNPLPPAIHFVETFKKNRDRADTSAPRLLTRGKIHALSRNPDKLARDQAERLMLMMRAEQELLTLSSSVFFIAAGLTIWCGWSISKLDDHVNNTWAEYEGLYIAPIWIYGVGLAFSETLHAWIEWRHLAPWRANRARSRSNSQSDASPGSGEGGAAFPVNRDGVATAVQVQVHVVTRHEVAETEEDAYGLRYARGQRDVGGMDPVGVTLRGEDRKELKESEESCEEEK
ncbi:hypothetical protein JCM11251_001732 [Rhodosporidiobolus azoricus]